MYSITTIQHTVFIAIFITHNGIAKHTRGAIYLTTSLQQPFDSLRVGLDGTETSQETLNTNCLSLEQIKSLENTEHVDLHVALMEVACMHGQHFK